MNSDDRPIRVDEEEEFLPDVDYVFSKERYYRNTDGNPSETGNWAEKIPNYADVEVKGETTAGYGIWGICRRWCIEKPKPPTKKEQEEAKNLLKELTNE